MKKTAAVAELKAHLSHYLKQVRAGAEILVTDRNVPIARLVPARAVGTDAERLLDLERQGHVRVGAGVLPKGFWKLARGRDPQGLVRKAVAEEREEGW